ncbi:MAG: hypothetical protein LiPW15_650 [Parcubacteria group bacterium LiPW_15]|nr:MAG: hypothetical protein LiPW15_650 [Parcubacteria group bacterium LiPW_15]
MDQPPKENRSRFADISTRWLGSIPSLIVHTVIFLAAFGFILAGSPTDEVLLILTTFVSLEAIYFSIFIQMTVNRATESIEEVSEDVEEIQEEVGEISEDVEDISEDVEEVQEDVKEIGEDVEEISKDVDKIQEDAVLDDRIDEKQNQVLENIEVQLQKLLRDIETLKK